MLKAVIFDIDDTLYEFSPVHTIALKKAHKKYGKYEKIPFKIFKKEFDFSWNLTKMNLKETASGSNRILIFQNLVERRLKRFDNNLVLSLYKQYWKSFFRNMMIYNGVIPLFKLLRKNKIKIALLSDLTTLTQLKKIKKLKISSFVDIFIGAEECGKNKPSKKIFKLALKKLSVKTNEILMVGDNASKDILGAKKFNIKTIQLVKGIFSKKMDGNLKAHYYAMNFSEIEKIIKKYINIFS